MLQVSDAAEADGEVKAPSKGATPGKLGKQGSRSFKKQASMVPAEKRGKAKSTAEPAGQAKGAGYSET